MTNERLTLKEMGQKYPDECLKQLFRLTVNQ